MLNHLERFTSFANAIRATGGLTAVLLISANCLMREKPHKAEAMVRPNFRIIFHDSPYLVSIASLVPSHILPRAHLTAWDRAFSVNLGLFFPCEHLNRPHSFLVHFLYSHTWLFSRFLSSTFRRGSWNTKVTGFLFCNFIFTCCRTVGLPRLAGHYTERGQRVGTAITQLSGG